jgi:glycosyltransferase involved in cell wall biosynthesis
MEYKLSVLIPTLTNRSLQLLNCVKIINKQIKDCEAFGMVEIIIDEDNRQVTTGAKRNRLIEKSKGKYFCFVDDDDEVLEGYIYEILKAIEKNPDCIPINGYMTTNGVNQKRWIMGIGMGYESSYENGVEYYIRFPNHLAVMKKELVKDYKFKDITIGEDYDWAVRIHNDKVLKTEVRIEKPLYHYKYIE